LRSVAYDHCRSGNRVALLPEPDWPRSRLPYFFVSASAHSTFFPAGTSYPSEGVVNCRQDSPGGHKLTCLRGFFAANGPLNDTSRSGWPHIARNSEIAYMSLRSNATTIEERSSLQNWVEHCKPLTAELMEYGWFVAPFLIGWEFSNLENVVRELTTNRPKSWRIDSRIA
jgi:hypothetical protein